MLAAPYYFEKISTDDFKNLKTLLYGNFRISIHKLYSGWEKKGINLDLFQDNTPIPFMDIFCYLEYLAKQDSIDSAWLGLGLSSLFIAIYTEGLSEQPCAPHLWRTESEKMQSAFHTYSAALNLVQEHLYLIEKVPEFNMDESEFINFLNPMQEALAQLKDVLNTDDSSYELAFTELLQKIMPYTPYANSTVTELILNSCQNWFEEHAICLIKAATYIRQYLLWATQSMDVIQYFIKHHKIDGRCGFSSFDTTNIAWLNQELLSYYVVSMAEVLITEKYALGLALQSTFNIEQSRFQLLECCESLQSNIQSKEDTISDLESEINILEFTIKDINASKLELTKLLNQTKETINYLANLADYPQTKQLAIENQQANEKIERLENENIELEKAFSKTTKQLAETAEELSIVSMEKQILEQKLDSNNTQGNTI